MSARWNRAFSTIRDGSRLSYRRAEAPDEAEHRALVQVVELPSGFRILVGRDLEERERIYAHHRQCRALVVRAGRRARSWPADFLSAAACSSGSTR